LVDEQARLIVGWDKKWCEYHRDMMPESVLSNIVTKLNTTGVEIDDVTPLSNFTQEQLMFWLLRNPDLQTISSAWTWSIGGDSKAWQVYDALSPADKELAKSDAGLPLGKLDTYALSELFKQLNSRMGYCPDFSKKGGRTDRKGYGLPEDPDRVAEATMRVTKVVPDSIRVASEGSKYRDRLIETPKGYDKHEWLLKISGEGTGPVFAGVFAGPLDLYCPVYSAKREAELLKAKKDSDAEKSP
jgi:hypothetical protein